MKTIRVRVPATTTNLGPGFDCLGMALSLWNDAVFCCDGLRRGRASGREAVRVDLRGEGTDELPTDRANLIWTAMACGLEACRLAVREVSIRCTNRIPLSSGLGSSGAACVAGLTAANALADGRLSRQRLLELATEIEGHADNAAAALWGGLTACFDAAGNPAVVAIPLRARVKVVVCTPDLRVPTAKSRAALPKRVPHRDATLAVGRAVALAAMLTTGDTDRLADAMNDTLHQSYRAALVPGMEHAFRAARKHGALGVFLSGAGPTVAAFVPAQPTGAEAVSCAIEGAFGKLGLAATSRVLNVDRVGARVLKA